MSWTEKITTPRLRMIAVVDGVETPFCKAGKELRGYRNFQLLQAAADACINRTMIAAGQPANLVDFMCAGIVVADPNVPNPARTSVLESRVLPDSIGATTVPQNCVSAIAAVVIGAQAICSSRPRKTGPKLVLAGGADSMTNGTVMFSTKHQRYFRELAATPAGWPQFAKALKRPWFVMGEAPQPVEPSTGMLMGKHCEQSVQEFGIDRPTQDEFTVESHRRAVAADAETARFTIPMAGLTCHPLPRPSTSVDTISGYPAIYDRSMKGTITKAHTGPLTDGAAMVLLAEPKYAEELGLSIRSYFLDYETAAISPNDGLLMAPGVAVPALLKRNGLTFNDLDRIEVHEAFAGQFLANVHVWENGWPRMGIEAVGKLPREKVNPWGGSIAFGHPFGATGGRVCNFLSYALKDQANREGRPTLGLGSICAAGAEAYAWLQAAYPDDWQD